ncbi:folate-binding protein [Cyanobium sp. Alchichica 3B3-8F6]|uniref:CAF17-like 4Fe-4S cluster assembly/insertion protein YgfZ n=1 Tax=Cyanobium sp. Alchichica 3B3-8F6 TaxID=2823696 RepID=UPI0020CB93D9|nr:folate-binding protein [Cyanobium sp. Alchichica 3B3-8F6]MCP9881797.1 folate-binding protein [Cyanobium sp. Alchichica 3B3-8F6]
MSPDPWSWQPAGPRRWEQATNLIRLGGADTRRFLHGQTSAAIESSTPGSWIPTCCITATGRLRALAEVLVDDCGAWLLLSSGDAEAVWHSLDRVLFPADQVRLGPVTPARWITPLGDALAALPQAPAGQWQALENGSGWLLGRQVVLLAEAELPPWLAERTPLTALEQERWRLQQGWPAAPGEINDDTNPFEAGLADRVSLSKGCYVGQETLAKLATYDGVKQQLRRWHGPAPEGSAAAPAQGTALFRLEGANNGSSGTSGSSRAGQITSALALEDGMWIGLALVRRQALQDSELRAGEGSQAPALHLSKPPAFVDPPVGAGRQG